MHFLGKQYAKFANSGEHGLCLYITSYTIAFHLVAISGIGSEREPGFDLLTENVQKLQFISKFMC